MKIFMIKQKLFLVVIIMIISNSLAAQVAINTDGNSADGSAMLEVKSTNKGLLPPRMTEAQTDGISSPAAGLLIFQTDETTGYYYYTGTDWIGLLGTGAGAISTSVCIDYDGNAYQTFTIGDQVWMAENLRVTHYKNGVAIPIETDGTAWSGLTSGAYCWFDNYYGNENYGPLYNWYAVDDSRGLCPDGWHVSTHAEWNTLATYLGGASVAGGKMKTDCNLWESPNIDATNISNFSGLPGGYRDNIGDFLSKTYIGYWWSSTEGSSSDAWGRSLEYNYSSVDEYDGSKRNGFSVRCLRD